MHPSRSPAPSPVPPYRELLRTVALGLGLDLSERQIEQLAAHFALLVQWNRKVNLTALRHPEQIARRHFEESLFLAKVLPPASGLLIDVGSGAGFPGLPLKVAWPSMPAVLLEPNRKKAAFLKEVARSCGLEDVEVRTERLSEAARGELAACASLVTMRAVAATADVLGGLLRLLRSDGRIALFVGEKDATKLATTAGLQWDQPVAIPRSERRVVLVGRAGRGSGALP